MGERTPHARGIDSGDDRGSDCDVDPLLALPWMQEDEEALIESHWERELDEYLEQHWAEMERREAEYQRELEEGISNEELQRRLQEHLARPIPDPEESARQAEQGFVPLTEEEAAALRNLSDPQP